MKLSKNITSITSFFIIFILLLSITSQAQAGIFKLLLNAGQEVADAGNKVGRKIDTDLPALNHLPDEVGVSKIGLEVHYDGSISLLSDTGQKWSVEKEGDVSTVISEIKNATSLDKTKNITAHKFYISSSELLRSANNLTLRKMDDLQLTHNAKAYPLKFFASHSNEQSWKINTSDSISIEVKSYSQINESLFQLKRSVNLANMRLVSFSNKTEKFPSKIQVASKQHLPDLTVINPDFLESSLNILKNQSLVITGKRSGDFLLVKGAKGKESKINIAKLTHDSAKHDVNLIIIEASSSAQPGTSKLPWKNAIKQKYLEQAFSSETYGEFLSSLSNKEMSFSIDYNEKSNSFVSFNAVPEPKQTKIASDKNWGDEIATHIVLHSVRLHTKSESYEKELQQRVIPGIPSWVHITLLLNIISGFLVIVFAFSNWQKIWKKRIRADFKGWFLYAFYQLGYFTVFVFAFLAIFGSILLVVRSIIFAFYLIVGILNILTWPFRAIFSLFAKV